MSVDMTKSYAFTFCDTDGGTTIAVEKSRYAAESFNAELETEYRARIGLDAWGDNSSKGDIKVDNKVDNNLGDDTVNGAASGPLSGLKSGLKSNLGATDSKVIDFIRSNPSVTIKELQELLNLSRNGVRKALGRLKSMGRLRRVGPDKGGHWEVVEK